MENFSNKQIFTINDIDLEIAPEAISIQTEDLVYSWQTLRTNSSTKIPSGHGQKLVQIRIPFIDDQILTLHRLIVEFRHSPFCHIENLFLRQSICPDWPINQNMAFTMTGLNLMPYPGTANAYVLNLELIWFNYFPYLHNWLYRKDWVTEWISSDINKAEPYYVKTSIGWNLDSDGNRKSPRVTIIEEKTSLEKEDIGHLEWSALNDSYSGKSLTVEDLELLHRGEVFDLMPMPSRMEKAGYVQSARDSNIYKRYINLLQRDALLQNFNIDIENWIGYQENSNVPDLYKALFSGLNVGSTESSEIYVHALHNFSVPKNAKVIEKDFFILVDRIISEMLQYKKGVEFGFATYKSVQMPNTLAQKSQDIIKKAKNSLIPQTYVTQNNDASPWIYADDKSVKTEVRRGLSEPKGFHVPIGSKTANTKRDFRTMAGEKMDFLHWRSAKTLSGIYSRSQGSGRFHWGFDITTYGLEGLPIYAVKDGTVSYVNGSANAGQLNKWRCLDFDGSSWKRIESVVETEAIQKDWIASVEKFAVKPYENSTAGTVIGSVEKPNQRVFYVDFGDGGQNVTLSHNGDRERSKYLHLNSILVKKGQSVKAGDIIGYSGSTSRIDKNYVANNITSSKSILTIPQYTQPIHPTVDVSEVVPHLHFEYYERKDFHKERTAVNEDAVTIVEARDSGFVPVDIRPTLSWAADQGFTSLITKNPDTEILKKKVLDEAIEDASSLNDDEQNSLLSIVNTLYEEGYYYFDRQSDVTNVWWKPWRINVNTSNPEYLEYDQIMQQDTAVLTSLSAGLRHIVANIPILGQEFPTQQHLGSIEPYYTLEFHLLDDTGNLEGIGQRGGILTGMRQLLQHNARKFRLIPDSWCLLTDCFFTRMLGTFKVADLKVSMNEDSVISDFVLDRRTTISRAEINTVEGHPGLSRLVWELQETKPFTQEALEIEAPKKTSVDAAREKILNALYKMEFIEKYKDIALTILLAQRAGANTAFPGETNFGKFKVYKTSNDGQLGESVGYVSYDVAFSTVKTKYYTEGISGTGGRGLGGEEVIVQAAPVLGAAYSNYLKQSNLVEQNIGNLLLIPDEQKIILEALENESIKVVSFNGKGILGNTKDTYLAVSETSLGLDKYVTEITGEYTNYDISSLISNNQESLLLGEIPIQKIYQLALILNKIIKSANMYMSEDQSLIEKGNIGGQAFTRAEVIDSLYKLPIEPMLLRTFQNYIYETAVTAYDPIMNKLGIGVSSDSTSRIAGSMDERNQVKLILEKNPNWLIFQSENRFNSDKVPELGTFWNVNGLLDLLGSAASPAVSMLASQLEVLWEKTKNIGRAFSAFSNGSVPELQEIWSTIYCESVKDICNEIVKHYVRSLPLIALAASEEIKGFIEDSIIGDVIGGINGDDNQVPAIANTRTILLEALISSGHFGPHPWTDAFPFFLETSESLKNKVQDADISGDFGGTEVNNKVQQLDPSISYHPKPVPYWQAVLNSTVVGPAYSAVAKTDDDWIRNSGIPLPGNPFNWNISRPVEEDKLRYFKQLLARLADACLQDPKVLKAFGLEGLAYIDRREVIKGKAAYPDLDLPYHPYYGDVYAVYPDFYMWNMYEDGDVFNSSTRKQVSQGMKFILGNCYNSMKQMEVGETGDNAYKPSQNRVIQDPSFDSTVALNLKFNAEGTDGTSSNDFNRGPTAYPFYPTDDTKESINAFFDGHSVAKQNADTNADNKTNPQNGTSVNRDKLENNKPAGIKMSNVGGVYGAAEGIQYPSRLSDTEYNELKSRVDSITDMFGSRSGFLKQKELPTSTEERLNGTPLERDLQPSHKFDLAALEQLAENSSNDLFSQKRRLASAYPTFKLYFVEEDEAETRLLNFDDFYSYNGIKDITFTTNRKYPADAAVITLQNVSGILDGTKRDAIVDLDYFTKKMGSKAIADNAPLQNTVEDQPFGSLVLRPGLNVQLRMGYANDPDLLQVLINGRVVDVQWNQQGDTAQITVQSFGAELMQIMKGTQPLVEEEPYYTTHQLLSAMTLEPELVHFGRWEFGRLYQLGESKDARFDFYEYSREANMGRFEHSSNAVKWLFNHPFITYAVAFGGVAAVSRIPGVGRFFSKASRWGTKSVFVNKMLSKLGIAGQLGQDFFEKELILAARNAGKIGDLSGTTKLSAFDVSSYLNSSGQAKLTKRFLDIGAKEGDAAFDAILKTEIRDGAKALWQKASSSGGITVAETAEALAKMESNAMIRLLKGQWFSNPSSTATGIAMVKDLGWKKPVLNLLKGSTSGMTKVLAVGAGAGLAADALSPLAHEILDSTLGRVERFFQAAKISIMLSPQDDNLFPPHPKDYMLLGQGWWQNIKKWATFTGASIISGSEEIGNLVGHYFTDTSPYDKRGPVEAYQYKIMGSYIWDIFHEMSLRHPGWVYGVRPYGKEFRYTMFFGVPSQRYWAVPADNLFVDRANKIVTMLENGINVNEYKSLYGDQIDGISVDSFETNLMMEAQLNASEKSPIVQEVQVKTLTGLKNVGSFITPDTKPKNGNTFEEKLEALHNVTFTGRALKEYLKALNLRFKPFRKYHTISSERDLVWNGIIGSENATYNAVDVTYFSEDIDDEENMGPVGSSIIKAHAFLPENMLRVKPLRPYTNCRGYAMAMRYGMGELLHTLRDMYRGELIVLGNPRINPWDICILLDTYNSMVGPFEVEEVTHNFSHGTGFITQIKPSAVVLANETSSWPVLEAMKMASLAVRNIEEDSLGMTSDSFGTIGKVVDWLGNNGVVGNEENEAYLLKQLGEVYGKEWDEKTQTFVNKEMSDIAFGNIKPDADASKTLNDSVDGVIGLASGAVNTTAVFLGGVSVLGAVGLGALKKKVPALGTGLLGTVTKVGQGGLVGAGVAIPGLALATDYIIDPPQLMSLLGGSLLFLQCLRGDSVMLVPLMKNGYPIVSGLNYHDPSMIWKNFLGELGKYADDVLDGSRDLVELWNIYGMYAWRRLPEWSEISLDSERQLIGVDMTGEVK